MESTKTKVAHWTMVAGIISLTAFAATEENPSVAGHVAMWAMSAATVAVLLLQLRPKTEERLTSTQECVDGKSTVLACAIVTGAFSLGTFVAVIAEVLPLAEGLPLQTIARLFVALPFAVMTAALSSLAYGIYEDTVEAESLPDTQDVFGDADRRRAERDAAKA